MCYTEGANNKKFISCLMCEMNFSLHKKRRHYRRNEVPPPSFNTKLCKQMILSWLLVTGYLCFG
jgi:hypothetical protein